jgi:hypothetical protein
MAFELGLLAFIAVCFIVGGIIWLVEDLTARLTARRHKNGEQ